MADQDPPNYVDDPTIGDEEILWRRILPEWIAHEADGSARPQSGSFVDRRSGELSVFIARLVTKEKILGPRTGDSIAAFKAGLPRSLGYKLVRDPDDPSHVVICPSPNSGDGRRIAKACEWALLQLPKHLG